MHREQGSAGGSLPPDATPARQQVRRAPDRRWRTMHERSGSPAGPYRIRVRDGPRHAPPPMLFRTPTSDLGHAAARPARHEAGPTESPPPSLLETGESDVAAGDWPD